MGVLLLLSRLPFLFLLLLFDFVLLLLRVWTLYCSAGFGTRAISALMGWTKVTRLYFVECC